jgi:hypothetical protein
MSTCLKLDHWLDLLFLLLRSLLKEPIDAQIMVTLVLLLLKPFLPASIVWLELLRLRRQVLSFIILLGFVSAWIRIVGELSSLLVLDFSYCFRKLFLLNGCLMIIQSTYNLIAIILVFIYVKEAYEFILLVSLIQCLRCICDALIFK